MLLRGVHGRQQRQQLCNSAKPTWLRPGYSYSTPEGEPSNQDGVLANALDFFLLGPWVQFLALELFKAFS
jgi:hypothetical protein